MRGIRLPHVGALVLCVLACACRHETGRLTGEQDARLNAEGVRHRADNARFRYTFRRPSGSGWEDRLASIIVTGRSVLIHRNEKPDLEITPQSRRNYEVHQDGRRVQISAQRGQVAESWTFEPSGDAGAWAQDIRLVIGGPKSGATP